MPLQRLRGELEQAKALYDGATEAYERAKREYDDLDTAPSNYLKRLIEIHEFTLENYALATKRFNGYLLRGDLPKPEPTLVTESQRA